ncbi:DUF1554 domain-containing protein [Aquella oligotrophica]|uniref:Ig-like domain-containing protein n=1 Tax=Aquella oligotrophica TaxID=2067065 RepID=A0A2I7N8G0_9NEIS|nr:DUF1554 domain-containing protein [Aquella oligotrophica]AUR52736.1 hypothetical protein CUN60_10650 [Aquella oligotrophica]
MKNLTTKTFVHGRSRRIQNLALAGITAAVLSACGGGSGGCCTVPPNGNSQLIFVAPSILPSLANKTGINYMGVYNPSDVAISGIKYSVGQQVGSGNSITMDQASALACANIAAKSSCYLKFSVPESTIAGGTVVSAIDSNGAEAATPLAIGVQQVPYSESANANGVGLYFYPKAQYSESGVPFILVTAVVQSPNVGTINTIELVDESGNVIPNQTVTSNNAGPGSSPLQMGDVVEIELPIPQGVNLTQNIKVRTSYQTLATSAVSSLAERLNLKSEALKATTNSSTSTATYTLTTQGNNINLQLTPNQVYLTQKDSIQYGYLYNIGDLTASQITVTSSSPNVKITVADEILNGQRVIKVTYELINTSVAPTTNLVTVTAQNPSGQTETSTGGTSQNVNPDVVPTPAPSPTPTPTPTPGPGPSPAPTTEAYAYIANRASPGALYKCKLGTNGSFDTCVTTPPSGGPAYPTGIAIAVSNNLLYAYIAAYDGGPYQCTINNNDGSLNNCNRTPSSGVSSWKLSGITFSTVANYSTTPPVNIQYAYLGDAFNKKVYKCTVGNNGNLSACGDTPSSDAPANWQPNGIAIAVSTNGTKSAYVAGGNEGKLYICTVDENDNADGSLSNCQATPTDNPPVWTPWNIFFTTINSINYAYVASSNGVYQCSLNNDGTFNICNIATPTSGAIAWSPQSVAFTYINGIQYAYVGSSTGKMYQCTLNSDGSFNVCTETPTTASPNFSAPVGIAFSNIGSNCMTGSRLIYAAHNGEIGISGDLLGYANTNVLPGSPFTSAIDAADAICNTDLSKPQDMNISYKAMLVNGSTRTAVPLNNWVLQPGIDYVNAACGVIGTANSQSVIPFDWSAPIDNSGNYSLRTGLQSDWTTSTDICSGWITDSNSVNSIVGHSTEINANAINSGIASCSKKTAGGGRRYGIYCVQQ